jgi:fluoroacetyl-CoA thioesterase
MRRGSAPMNCVPGQEGSKRCCRSKRDSLTRGPNGVRSRARGLDVLNLARPLARGLKVPYRTGVLFRPGLNARVSLVVGKDDTALAMRSGAVEVLSTPRLIALCEEASCAAVGKALTPEHTTVGVRVQFDHLAPVQVGGEVTAEAVLERVEGRRLTFTVSATDAAGLVGAGRVTRVVVNTDAFLAKAR